MISMNYLLCLQAAHADLCFMCEKCGFGHQDLH